MTGLAVRCLIAMTAVLLAAGLGTWLLRNRLSAAQRHAVWTVALVLALALPLILQWEPPAGKMMGRLIAAQGGVEVQRVFITVSAAQRTPVNWLRAVWLVGAAGAVFWWLLGFLRVARIVARSKEFSTFQGVRVRTGAGLKMPAVAFGPVILLPESAASWPPARLEMVLTHELAHVRRRDLLWQLAARLACCAYWFHPLAWWAAARQRRESEMSCDDRVLHTNGAAAYAESLVAVAREASGHALPAAALAMARPNELEGRVVALLDPRRRRSGASLLTAVGALAVGLILVSPMAAWQDPTGVQMRGSVRDIVGLIPGAKIVLTVDGGSPYTFETGEDGSYSISGVPEGKYRVEVLKAGYQKNSLGPITIGSKLQRLDYYLELGTIRETMTVDGGKAETRQVTNVTSPTRLRISGNVQAAKMVHQVRPVYPKEAKAAGIQGLVRMQSVISKEGDVMSLKLLAAPSAELARAAMESVNQWKYSPTLLNGEPVEVVTFVDVNFTLAP